MKETPKVLFLDVGGVLLTNGWDHGMREKAAEKFHLNLAEFNKRHALTFDTYEIGKISLDVYLDRAVFHTKRDFSREEFKAFMFAQSQPYQEMLDLMQQLKKEHDLKVVVISNEGRELMEYRIQHFQLAKWIDFFVSSSFVGLRKPDEAIFKLALDLAQCQPHEAIYIDDREMLAEIATQMGMKGFQHTAFEKTQQFLQKCFKTE